jgi:hypothetical protein
MNRSYKRYFSDCEKVYGLPSRKNLKKTETNQVSTSLQKTSDTNREPPLSSKSKSCYIINYIQFVLLFDKSITSTAIVPYFDLEDYITRSNQYRQTSYLYTWSLIMILIILPKVVSQTTETLSNLINIRKILSPLIHEEWLVESTSGLKRK